MLSLGSIAAAAMFARSHSVFAFYMIVTRFWDLALGFVLANILIRLNAGLLGGVTMPMVLGWFATACGISLLLALVCTPEKGSPFPGALLPCLATGGLLVAAY